MDVVELDVAVGYVIVVIWSFGMVSAAYFERIEQGILGIENGFVVIGLAEVIGG